MRRWGRYVPITLGLLGAACSTPLEPQDDLAIAQRRWQAAAIADYSFTFQRSCFCLHTATRAVTVTVHQRAWATLMYEDDGTAADTSLFRDFLTMERVFSFLRGSLEEDPATFEARYDAQLGYPAEVSIDYLANAIDDELSLWIAGFRITGGP